MSITPSDKSPTTSGTGNHMMYVWDKRANKEVGRLTISKDTDMERLSLGEDFQLIMITSDQDNQLQVKGVDTNDVQKSNKKIRQLKNVGRKLREKVILLQKLSGGPNITEDLTNILCCCKPYQEANKKLLVKLSEKQKVCENLQNMNLELEKRNSCQQDRAKRILKNARSRIDRTLREKKKVEQDMKHLQNISTPFLTETLQEICPNEELGTSRTTTEMLSSSIPNQSLSCFNKELIEVADNWKPFVGLVEEDVLSDTPCQFRGFKRPHEDDGNYGRRSVKRRRTLSPVKDF